MILDTSGIKQYWIIAGSILILRKKFNISIKNHSDTNKLSLWCIITIISNKTINNCAESSRIFTTWLHLRRRWITINRSQPAVNIDLHSHRRRITLVSMVLALNYIETLPKELYIVSCSKLHSHSRRRWMQLISIMIRGKTQLAALTRPENYSKIDCSTLMLITISFIDIVINTALLAN